MRSPRFRKPCQRIPGHTLKNSEAARYEPRAPGLRRCGGGRGQPSAHLGGEARAETAASCRADKGVGIRVLCGEEGREVRVGGVAHPVVRVAPRPPVRRHSEGDLLRDRQRRESCRVWEARLRWVEGAAAAGGGEEAEERAGARAPAEHRRRFDGFALHFGYCSFSLLRKKWAGPLLMVGVFVKVDLFSVLVLKLKQAPHDLA